MKTQFTHRVVTSKAFAITFGGIKQEIPAGAVHSKHKSKIAAQRELNFLLRESKHKDYCVEEISK